MNVPVRGAAAAAVALASSIVLAVPHVYGQPSAAGSAAQDPALVARAQGIHERVIKADTHVDIDVTHFTPDCNYTMRLTTQVNLPKMDEGDLDAPFFIVYVGQGPLTAEGYDDAYREAIAKFDAIHRFTEEIAPDRMGLALTPADVRRLVKEGKRAAVIGVENGYPVGDDLKRVQEFYDRGGRYMSLAHNGHSQLSDSNTGEQDGWKWNGLSPLGKQVVAEMNRLGMMIDISHPSKASMLQTIELSKAPIIASHSSVRALANHSRNLDDEQLLALKKNGGVAQMVALSSYVKADPPERAEMLSKLRSEFFQTDGGRGQAAGSGRGAGTMPATAKPAVPPCPVEGPSPAGSGAGRGGGGGRGAAMLAQLTPERRADYEKRLADIDAKWPAAGRATVKDFVDHIDYAAKLIGIDHVGISSDFDGGGGIDGWNSAAETFNVTLELLRRGYTEEQIAKLWSGNLLRVWEDVAKAADSIQAGRR